jgi:hypothetical protein
MKDAEEEALVDEEEIEEEEKEEIEEEEIEDLAVPEVVLVAVLMTKKRMRQLLGSLSPSLEDLLKKNASKNSKRSIFFPFQSKNIK